MFGKKAKTAKSSIIMNFCIGISISTEYKRHAVAADEHHDYSYLLFA